MPRNKKPIILKRVHHFSGGSSSAMMVAENYQQGDLVIFCDTESPKTYKFIDDFERIEQIPIIRLKMVGGWKKMLKDMRDVPNRAKRRCTIFLKIKTARRYLRTLGLCNYIQFVGFRYDEKERIDTYVHFWKKVKTEFPLDAMKADKPTVNNYWIKKGYKLEIPPILSNCDLCFMKGEDKVIAILTNDISLADKWIGDEEDIINNPEKFTYFIKTSMRVLRDTAQDFINKGKVFDLTDIQAKFSCSCSA